MPTSVAPPPSRRPSRRRAAADVRPRRGGQRRLDLAAVAGPGAGQGCAARPASRRASRPRRAARRLTPGRARHGKRPPPLKPALLAPPARPGHLRPRRLGREPVPPSPPPSRRHGGPGPEGSEGRRRADTAIDGRGGDATRLTGKTKHGTWRTPPPAPQTPGSPKARLGVRVARRTGLARGPPPTARRRPLRRGGWSRRWSRRRLPPCPGGPRTTPLTSPFLRRGPTRRERRPRPSGAARRRRPPPSHKASRRRRPPPPTRPGF